MFWNLVITYCWVIDCLWPIRVALSDKSVDYLVSPPREQLVFYKSSTFTHSLCHPLLFCKLLNDFTICSRRYLRQRNLPKYAFLLVWTCIIALLCAWNHLALPSADVVRCFHNVYPAMLFIVYRKEDLLYGLKRTAILGEFNKPSQPNCFCLNK